MSVPTAARRSTSALRIPAHQAAIILTGILAGAIVATWLTEASLAGSTELWISYHQAITKAYTLALPPIGALALIAAVWALVGSGPGLPARRLILVAIGWLLLGLVVTVVVHFPINAEIATWQAAGPPADWHRLYDRWLLAHGIRAAAALAAFTLLVFAALQPDPKSSNPSRRLPQRTSSRAREAPHHNSPKPTARISTPHRSASRSRFHSGRLLSGHLGNTTRMRHAWRRFCRPPGPSARELPGESHATVDRANRSSFGHHPLSPDRQPASAIQCPGRLRPLTR